MFDDGCDLNICFACRFESLPKVTLRGDMCGEGQVSWKKYFAHNRIEKGTYTRNVLLLFAASKKKYPNIFPIPYASLIIR